MTVHETGEGQLSVETRESEETEALAGTLAALRGRLNCLP